MLIFRSLRRFNSATICFSRAIGQWPNAAEQNGCCALNLSAIGRCTQKNCLQEVANSTPAWQAGAQPSPAPIVVQPSTSRVFLQSISAKRLGRSYLRRQYSRTRSLKIGTSSHLGLRKSARSSGLPRASQVGCNASAATRGSDFSNTLRPPALKRLHTASPWGCALIL